VGRREGCAEVVHRGRKGGGAGTGEQRDAAPADPVRRHVQIRREAAAAATSAATSAARGGGGAGGCGERRRRRRRATGRGEAAPAPLEAAWWISTSLGSGPLSLGFGGYWAGISTFPGQAECIFGQHRDSFPTWWASPKGPGKRPVSWPFTLLPNEPYGGLKSKCGLRRLREVQCILPPILL
jgi:hypothetical protein